MKRFTHSTELPAAAADVVATVSTEAYLRYRYEDASLDEFRLDVLQDDADAFECRVTRSGRPARLPAFAAKMLGERATLVQTTRWERAGEPYRGEVALWLEGLPGRISGTLTLSDSGPDRSRLAADGRIEVDIPLLGRRIEALLVERAEEGFAASAEAIARYIREE